MTGYFLLIADFKTQFTMLNSWGEIIGHSYFYLLGFSHAMEKEVTLMNDNGKEGRRKSQGETLQGKTFMSSKLRK